MGKYDFKTHFSKEACHELDLIAKDATWQRWLRDDAAKMVRCAMIARHWNRARRVLDIGCGLGHFGPFFLALGADEYVGIDFTECRIRYNRDHFSDDRMKFICGDITKDTPAGRFDFVWSCTVLQHMEVEEKLRTIEVIRNLLTDDGVALFYEGRIFHDQKCLEKRTGLSHMVGVLLDDLILAAKPFQFRCVGPLFYEMRKP